MHKSPVLGKRHRGWQPGADRSGSLSVAAAVAAIAAAAIAAAPAAVSGLL